MGPLARLAASSSGGVARHLSPGHGSAFFREGRSGMIDTKAYRDCARTGRAELMERVSELCTELKKVRRKLAERTNGLNLPGWFCPGCGIFNGETKEKREECRGCDGVFIDVSPTPLELREPEDPS